MLPSEVDEAENPVVPVRFADAGVGMDEQPGIGIAGEKGEDAFLPAAAAAPGDIVFFNRRLRIPAVPGDGMEVEVEGAVAAEIGPEAVQGPVPAVHETGAQLRIDPAGIFRQGRAIRHGVQPGEQGGAGIEDVGHHMRRPSDPPQLQRQQGPEGMASRDPGAPRHAAVGDNPVEIDADGIGDEQEQSAETGAQAPRRQVESPGIGRRGGIGAQGRLPFSGRPPPQLADAVEAQDAVHAGRAGGYPLLREPFADLPDREAGGPAEFQDAPFPPQPQRLFGFRFRPRPGFGEECGDIAVTAKFGAQILAVGNSHVSVRWIPEPAMDKRIIDLKLTTISGHHVTQWQTTDIRETVQLLPNGSRNGLGKTVREHLGWTTARSDYRAGTCFGMLETP